MKNRKLVATSVLVSLLSFTGLAVAGQHGMANQPHAPGMSGANNMPGPMGNSANMPRSGMSGMMMGDQAGMGGMMMGGCPLMAGMGDVLSPREQMKMHAEMMQSMGQIMQKYADRAE
ncbi:hypothetical protein G9Q38_06790 [Pusillimonas sp. DMV24BSW_D]|uniref:hypothetical protein n=1 Tax=Neopusillimonas aestuarii TaxID=2716226 RepID=UPI00140B3D36|nr:hypothetical protein [Pusillimonas sp. DMV24BSW_D]QIM48907.1 hypothetical protein G9Q38_06790 [Pusillimonas sp. DMV24BSW_D]